MIGLFCKRALRKRRHSTKENYNFKEPTNHSHPIPNQIIERDRKRGGCFCRYVYTRITYIYNIYIYTFKYVGGIHPIKS